MSLGLVQDWVWKGHFAAVAFMTGLIWLIQLVHYPLMSLVDRTRFAEFHAAHSFRITWIVGPVMALELVTAGLLPVLLVREPLISYGCLGLTGLVFASTVFLSVPEHARIAGGFEVASHSRLVRTNWVRTIAWSLHLVICLLQ